MTITSIATRLREEVAANRGPEDGSVVRFDRRIAVVPRGMAVSSDTILDTTVLTYAAIFAAGHWYLTGTAGLATRRLTHRAFLDLLASPDVTNVATPTDWEVVL